MLKANVRVEEVISANDNYLRCERGGLQSSDQACYQEIHDSASKDFKIVNNQQ